MKVITIIQPWATLIMLGEKKFETRSWATKHRGELGIHASKKVDKNAWMNETIYMTLRKHGILTVNDFPTGAIIATCNITDCWDISRCLRGDVVLEKNGGDDRREDPIGKNEEAFGFYDDGRFAWELTDVKQIDPIPTNGQLGLWNYNQ